MGTTRKTAADASAPELSKPGTADATARKSAAAPPATIGSDEHDEFAAAVAKIQSTAAAAIKLIAAADAVAPTDIESFAAVSISAVTASRAYSEAVAAYWSLFRDSADPVDTIPTPTRHAKAAK